MPGPQQMVQVPQWVTVGIPPFWDPHLPANYAFMKVPGVEQGGKPYYALRLIFSGQMIVIPFNHEAAVNLARDIQQVTSGLILP